MEKPIQLAMLIDDSDIDNMLHTRTLKKSGLVEHVIAFEYAEEALKFLSKGEHGVDVIFLDINMPRMDGFEFLAAYSELKNQQATTIVTMLSTSSNPTDEDRAKSFSSVAMYHAKPLTTEAVQMVVDEHFS